MKKPPASKNTKAAPVTKHATAATPHHATPATKHPAVKPGAKHPVAKTPAKHPVATHKAAASKHPVTKHPQTHAVAKHPAAVKKHSVTKGRAAAKKATLGGKCVWLAFGVSKPWYRRGAQRLETVAALAGYVPGPVQAGGVVCIRFDEGYHAARMVSDSLVDLWGELYPVTNFDIEESWCLAD